MWDQETPLLFLKSMPNGLEDENFKKLQLLLEADRYKNQIFSGVDLCGIYAPFCYGCDKNNKYPCAVSYVNYIKEQEAENKPIADNLNLNTESVPEENVEEQLPETDNSESVPEISEAEEKIEEEKIEEVGPEEENKPEEALNELPEEPQKTKIRIASARKKTIL